LSLPVRTLDIDATPDQTLVYRKPGGTMTLRPIQSACLLEIRRAGGLLGAVGCGWGKTGVAFLAPTVLEAQRPLLVIPAKMRAQCAHDLAVWDKHFVLQALTIRTYEELSSPTRSDMLSALAPDLIIFDEAHKIAAEDSVRTRRVRRYLRAHSETKIVAMSGTLTKRGLVDYAHLAMWSLGTGSPLPMTFGLLRSWSAVIDGGDQTPTPADVVTTRRLVEYFGQGNVNERHAFRQRLVSTPGVVATSEQGVGATLVLFRRSLRPPEPVRALIHQVNDLWQAPNGDEIEDALVRYQVLSQVVCGFHYYWDWSPLPWSGTPDLAWLAARSLWAKTVRETLQRHSRTHFDSPMLLAKAVQNMDGLGIYRVAGQEIRVPPALREAWAQWAPYRDRPVPPTLYRWLDDYLVNDIINWASLQPDPPLVWYTHRALAERLIECTGWTHYGDGPEASERLLRVQQPEPAIISVAAHSDGKNLQAWGNQVVAGPISTGARWEQMLARTHRAGQVRDEVWAAIYTQDIFGEAFEQAVEDAAYIEESTGQMQRLCYAVEGC